ncbi:MAG: hypothetical protein ACYC27_16630 [Armatimonadota bacterium]
MFITSIGNYRVYSSYPGLPEHYSAYAQYAKVAEEFDLDEKDGDIAFFGVRKDSSRGWPSLIVAWRCDPGVVAGFYPEALIVPETDILFLGGGDRIFVYDLTTQTRIWDGEHYLFTSWARYGDTVILSGDCDFEAWDIHGKRLWYTWVEPPWHYTVEDGWVNLDVMGKKSRFTLVEGPKTTDDSTQKSTISSTWDEIRRRIKRRPPEDHSGGI